VKVQLDRTLALPAGADVAWALLQDLEQVASCMPGASITGRIDERHFKGTVTVRVGPASLAFRGEIEVQQVDPASRTLRLLGKGTDSTGGSGASMKLTARIEDAGDGSTLVGASEVSMSGKAAAFGARAFSAVADQVLKQFATNFAARVAARAAQPPAAGSAAPVSAPPVPSAAAGSRELNAFALLWAVLRGWLRALFQRPAA
jgi:uncharacterized protein